MNRIKQLREEMNKSKAQIAREIGMKYTTYVNYETGARGLSSETILQFAEFFKCSTDYLIGKSNERTPVPQIIDYSQITNIIPLPKTKKVPLVGTIACGEPITAEENIEEYLNMPEQIGGTFALRCKGDSMINARIYDGDIVYIREQPEVENGEIAAVLIDGEATLKRVYQYENRIELRPENPMFKALNYEGEEINNMRILGKAVGFFGKIN